MRRFTIAAWIMAGAATLWNPTPADAQAVANATIHGVITDSSGAVVPHATIKATQADTGQVRSTVSGSYGSYVLPNLPVGPYTVEANAAGFSNYVQSGIILEVGNDVAVNVTLQLGTVSQQVAVSANAAMVETADTSISQVVDQRRIVDLPLNGRQATDLILLSGGADVPPNAPGRLVTTHDYPTSVAVSVSGGQINGNNYLLDGGDHNDVHSNINLPFPFPDALQEFSVQTNGVSARYGLHPGSVVNVVTKSGTNQFHGGLFEFVRNGDFNARNFFAPAQDTLRRNQFGGLIGGPIKKDRIFFFGGYQGTRTRTAPPQTIGYTPTQATLSGDFSTIESAACQSSHKALTLIDPTTGQPFPNNFISPTRFSAPALALLKNVPISTDPCGQIIYSIPNPIDENQYIGRLDWLLSPKHSFFGRYFLSDYDNPPFYTNNILTTTRAGITDRVQSITLGDQYNISPTTVNSAHATFNRLAINRAAPSAVPSPDSVGINVYSPVPHYIYLFIANHYSIEGGSNDPGFYNRNQYHFSDDVDMVRGRHHFSYGGEVRVIQMNTITNNNGEYDFDGSMTNDPLADYFIGGMSSFNQANRDDSAQREKYIGAYLQDDFQATSRLNVHFGVRWEPSLVAHDYRGQGEHFSLPAFLADQKTTKYVNAPPGLQYYPTEPGIPKAYANGNWVGFAPRVGFAWDPSGNGKQSIRASFGIFFDSPEAFELKDFSQAPPWGNFVTLTAPAGGLVNPYQGYPGGNPFPTVYPPNANAIFNTDGAYNNLPLNLHHTYMEQWDLSYQRQLTGNWLVAASYVGNIGMHLRAATELNPAVYIPGASTLANTEQRRVLYLLNPVAGAAYSTITQMDDGATTNYNALRLSAQHRFANNFTFLTVYTWSHCLQDAETINNRLSLGSNSYQNPYNRDADRAVCDSDLRHNVTASVVYEVPEFADRALNAFLGHWRFSLLASAHPGFPYSPVSGTDNSLTGVGLDRPNVIGDPYVRNMTSRLWVTPTAFVKNAPGTYGNAGYNSLLGPGFFDVDANLARFFQIGEHQRIELRFEFFNLLNDVNFGNPVNSFKSATFGLIQSADDPRILQFALKYSF